MKRIIHVATLLLLPLAALHAAKPKDIGDSSRTSIIDRLPESPEQARQRTERLKWFREAKYGLFINWGLYSIPAGDWKGRHSTQAEFVMKWNHIPIKEYEQLAKRFNPTKFNADEWAQLAVDAGMKYIVFDCKHCDGFAMYRSTVSKYNVYDATPWKRDPFKELQVACAKRGLKLCFYYDQAQDWRNPGGGFNGHAWDPAQRGDFDQYFRKLAMPQVKELLTNYGPIGLIWFDSPVRMTARHSQQMVELVRSLQPNTLINSRLGPGFRYDYFSPRDNEVLTTANADAWETPATLNNAWGYVKKDNHWKTPEQICFKLVDIVSKGGNYLLNVGPDTDGVIPQPSVDVLYNIGAWLKVNGEAIYGAGHTPFGAEFGKPVQAKDEYGRLMPTSSERDWRCTTKPGKLYIHLFKWPDVKFELTGVKNKVTKAYLLADTDHKPLPFTLTDGKLVVSLPEKAPDALASVLCLENQ